MRQSSRRHIDKARRYRTTGSHKVRRGLVSRYPDVEMTQFTGLILSWSTDRNYRAGQAGERLRRALSLKDKARSCAISGQDFVNVVLGLDWQEMEIRQTWLKWHLQCKKRRQGASSITNLLTRFHEDLGGM